MVETKYQMFVDAKDRGSALKKARKKINKKITPYKTKREIFSMTKQEYSKNRWVVWYRVRTRK